MTGAIHTVGMAKRVKKTSKPKKSPKPKRRRNWFLEKWRNKRGFSQEKLGAMVNLTQGMISHLETGESDYTGEHLELLAEALDCTVFQLLFVDPDWGDDHPIAVFLTFTETEQRQAVELTRTVRRTTHS